MNPRLLIVAGKGGVGRTTLSMVLANFLAARGKKILLAHARGHQRLSELLHAPIVDPEVRSIRRNLWAVNMNPHDALREFGMMVLKFQAIYRAVFENRLAKHLIRGIPSLEDYAMLGKAWYHTTEKNPDGEFRYDTVIFDGPATGHLLSMLRIPQIILEVVPEGPLTKDALQVQQLLTHPEKTAVWLVTLAEEMPTSEAIDFYRIATDELRLPVNRLVVNGVYPIVDENVEAIQVTQAEIRMGSSETALMSLIQAARILQRRHVINRRYLEQLHAAIPIPQHTLPYLFCERFDHRAIEELVREFELGLNDAR